MRTGITRRQMLLGNLAGLLGGIVAALFGPWLGRGRAARDSSVAPSPAVHPFSRGYTNDPLYQVTTYTYDAGALTRVTCPEPGSVTTYTYDGDWRPDGWPGKT